VIAVDASLIGAFILKEDGWENFADILENALTIDHAIKEVSNAIWKAHIKGYIGLEDVKTKFEALKKLFSLNLTIVSEIDLLDKTMEISLSQRIPVYDSLYIALAITKKASFSSLDKTQLNVAKEMGIPIVQASTPKKKKE